MTPPLQLLLIVFVQCTLLYLKDKQFMNGNTPWESTADGPQYIIVSFPRLALDFMEPRNWAFLACLQVIRLTLSEKQKTCMQTESTSLVIYNVKGPF